PERHPLAGHTKDLAAAGVLLTATGAVVVGVLIFLPRLMKLL
ncbi:MAG TPA: diacylglycerol kinase, partial [Bacteroidetes bacterium]|nr:diacylglycerol kinase [Bacteroidota bacterium]